MHHVKKILILTALPLFLLFTPKTVAATISLTPANISVHEGENFAVDVYVNPSGAKGYTVKMDASFTPQTLKISGWNFENTWIPINQPNYDLIDNKQGKLIKTAGYGNGFTNTILLGKANFTAEKAGQAVITINSNALIYNELGKNTYTGANTVSINILPKSVTTTALTKTQEKTDQATKNITEDPKAANTQVSQATTQPGINPTIQPDSQRIPPTIFDVSTEVSPQVTTKTGPYLVLITAVLILTIILVSIAIIIYKDQKRRSIIQHTLKKHARKKSKK